MLTCAACQLAEPGAVRCDALEHPRLAQRKVVSVRLEVGEHGGLHRPVRDEQQKPEVQRLRGICRIHSITPW